MNGKLVAYNSKEYWQLVALRDKTLRQPLGLKFSKQALAKESTQLHFGIFEEEEAIACVVLDPISSSKIKMRQVCTKQEAQGKGIGKYLLDYCEKFAKNKNYTLIYCHARISARTFYVQQGYQTKGNIFEEIGIAHVLMEKQL